MLSFFKQSTDSFYHIELDIDKPNI